MKIRIVKKYLKVYEIKARWTPLALKVTPDNLTYLSNHSNKYKIIAEEKDGSRITLLTTYKKMKTKNGTGYSYE